MCVRVFAVKTFHQLPVKMFHLESCVCGSYLCVCVGLLAVKMFHLSAVICQDAPSLGMQGELCVCESLYVCVTLLVVKMFYLSAPTCQDLPSLAGEVMRTC